MAKRQWSDFFQQEEHINKIRKGEDYIEKPSRSGWWYLVKNYQVVAIDAQSNEEIYFDTSRHAGEFFRCTHPHIHQSIALGRLLEGRFRMKYVNK